MSDNIIFAGAYKNDIEPATIIEIINIALENLLLNYTKTGDIMELLIIAMIASLCARLYLIESGYTRMEQ